ncbi:MAG TPA: YceI family protein [Rubrivivax sp.]|nr:YceI family protein [Rubrivivax sp.]
MTSHCTVALLACCTFAALAQSPPQAKAQLQPAASEIAFTTRQMGVPVEGRFAKFSANVALDPKSPQSGEVSLSIDTASARFGAPELDAELPKPGWLDAARFPQASFQSTAIKPAASGGFDVQGKLTIKGQARDVAVPVRLQPAAGGLTQASGSFTVKRLDFAVGSGEWSDTSLLANDVHVRFRLVFSGLVSP